MSEVNLCEAHSGLELRLSKTRVTRCIMVWTESENSLALTYREGRQGGTQVRQSYAAPPLRDQGPRRNCRTAHRKNFARVVVWEWLNEHGRWRPYSATVCHHIENIIKSNARGSVVLGQADAQLSPYIIDLQSMHQFRQDTGTMRPVRRNFYDPSSAPGKGIVWEWENDSCSWTPYDMDICITIQNAYEKQHPWLDLTSLGFCYIIDFNSMCQMNRQTQRKRRLRRRMDLAYPLTMGSIPKSQSWPIGTQSGQPCSCQQCVLVNSTRAASNAILASQRRKIYSATNGTLTVRQSNSYNGTALWSTVSTAATTPPKPEQARSPTTTQLSPISQSQGTTTTTPIPGQNNLNRPGAQRSAVVSTRASIPPGVPALPVKNLNGSGPVHPALAGMTGILMCAAGLPVCLTRAPKPILHPPPVNKSEIKPVPGISGICRKTKKKHLKKGKSPEDVVRRYMQKVKNPPDEDGSLQCPTCKAIYGEKTGTQPPGKMEYHLIPHSLPGYPEFKTIRIVYDIPAGLQGVEHPNQGKRFTARGFPRHCYLPDNEKGRKILKLLIVAWDRRLIFTIGTSNTTGETDTVVWNEIHHKTEFGSNLTGHGYPDPNYLENVLAELSAQGVMEDCIKD
ncbi:E3 ubiquitin-protein ligase DTX1-like isoform X2 [Narcine bancroftii]|uniref:E3 ubiquitin-protein ligase DTX1-like isoform X2 n=1 Tax=Narcine bancroftii TaxID=1343680 RepID=UPI0038310A6F